MSRLAIIGLLAFVLAACARGSEPPGDLKTILKAARGGEVIELQPGHYGVLELEKRRFSRPVIIDGKGDAVFERIDLQQVENLTFKNIKVRAGRTDKPRWVIAFNAWRSRSIRLLSSDIAWSPDGNPNNDGIAITARLSDGVLVEDTLIHHAVVGMVARDSDNIIVRNNRFQDLRVDGINITGSVGVVFEDNICTDFHPNRPEDHPDCVQLWNDTADRPNTNITIRRNQILRGEGGVSQGIFISGQKEGLWSRNLLIEDNIIHQGMGMGIHLTKAEDAVVRGNRLTPAAPIEFPPALVVRSPVANIVVENNSADHFEVHPQLIEKNLVTLSENNTAARPWQP